MLKTGDRAPDFKALDHDGKDVTLKGLLAAGKRLILYFYPRDNTPGCTTEACDFRDNAAFLDEKGATVVGVSPDSSKSHAGFREKYGLPFTLLVDTDKAIATAYGAYGEKTSYGKATLGIIRSTFVISPEGKIEKAMYGVKAAGHVEQVVKGLGG